jgi:hypothetical protein
MRSLEIYQDGTTNSWWVVVANGEDVYRSDGLHSVVSWLRSSQYADWGVAYFDIQPRS